MKPKPDPWREALDRWTAAGPNDAIRPPGDLTASSPERRTIALSRPRVVGVIAAAAVLLGAAVAGGVLTVTNRERAELSAPTHSSRTGTW